MTEIYKRLTIYINEQDRWNGKPLYHAILHKAKELGMAGTTVVRAAAGFGKGRYIHSWRIFDLSFDMPIIIYIIDLDSKIEIFLHSLTEMMKGEGFITIEEIQIL